jgi:lycopene cyclase domain-containing protein
MVMIDRRYKLAFFDDARRAAIVLASSVSVFVLWDLAGIALGIFRKGESDLALDFTILPELPLEELLFLFLLTYLSLLAYVYFSRKRAA